MAGQPKRKAIYAELERKARETLDDSVGQPGGLTVLDYAEIAVSGGTSLLRIANEIAKALDSPVYRSQVVKALENKFGVEAVTQSLARAREASAHALADETAEISDETVNTSPDAARQATRIRARQWLAERANRAAFGADKQQALLSISIGSLHLDALRAAPSTLPSLQAADTADAELDALLHGDIAQVIE